MQLISGYGPDLHVGPPLSEFQEIEISVDCDYVEFDGKISMKTQDSIDGQLPSTRISVTE